jgi:hypothetical protein
MKRRQQRRFDELCRALETLPKVIETIHRALVCALEAVSEFTRQMEAILAERYPDEPTFEARIARAKAEMENRGKSGYVHPGVVVGSVDTNENGPGECDLPGRDKPRISEVCMPDSTTTASPRNPSHKWSIPERYKGIDMRSRLEVKYAKFFDAHRMEWAYEPEGFQILGVRYLPDFYLPAIKTIVEVKGVLDSSDIVKLGSLVPAAAKNDVMTILAEPGEPVKWRLCHPTPEMERTAQFDPVIRDICDWPFTASDINDDAALVKCAACGRWYFIDSSASWQCMACGAYNGNMTFEMVHPGSSGWNCHDCPECGVAA